MFIWSNAAVPQFEHTIETPLSTEDTPPISNRHIYKIVADLLP